MDKRLNECLQGKQGDYILPFLWLHGEPKERVRQEILAIKASGINQLCAESRPYKDFCRDEWWDDFGYILDVAKELNMRVWLLDDQKFPTGYANGYLEREEHKHLRKKLIREYQIEAAGPMRCAKLLVGGRLGYDEEIYSVIAYKYTGKGEELDFSTAVVITATVENGVAYWDIPDGIWRVCVTVRTSPYKYKDDRFFYYIDMLNYDSCTAMINEVYETHYRHFPQHFGKTFAGFFSDEPGFLNEMNSYYNSLGVMYSPYPWSDELIGLIAKSAGITEKEVELLLPALWEDLGSKTALIRTHYMEVVTKLYSRNFTYQLGDWCRSHGVMYIGHVIEDMGAHMRLGYGSGHFFRALDGQDMAGIDIVLMQDIPGDLDVIHRSPLADGGVTDPAFFHYTLPKLASSHAHIQPLKQGRAMCELFGAFGWAEGLPFMKGLADTMLVGGVNHFVPHAFSPMEEDPDCPPHFYNGGKNPQYPLFKDLMEYMGRCSHLLQGGAHKADVCVFYNAEGEWATTGNKPFFEICKILTQGLVDFDIVPYDALENASVENGKLVINGEDYGALIVSECPCLPYSRFSAFDRLAGAGLRVIFENNLPEMSAEGKDILPLLDSLVSVPQNQLVAYLRELGLCHVSGEGQGMDKARFYHIQRNSRDIYLISNEDINHTLKGTFYLKQAGECLIYEPWGNKIYRYGNTNGELELTIEGGNMLFAIFGEEINENIPMYQTEKERVALNLTFDISLVDEGTSQEYKIAQNSTLFDITAPSKYPTFSGEVIYRTSFTPVEFFDVIDLGQVGEAAQVYLNGKYMGARINSPYKFNLKDGLRAGENTLEIRVKSSPAHPRPEGLSSYIPISPTGILGDISLCRYS